MFEQMRVLKTKLAEQATEITEMKNKISDLITSVNKTKEECVRLTKKNKDLKDRMEERESVISRQNVEINELEQYTRRNSIRIYGMNDENRFESVHETTKNVSDLLKNNVNITPADIDIAHRLGPYRPDGNGPVICKFIARNNKLKTIRARKNLKGTALVIREDLTLKNAKLLEEVTRRDSVKNAWSDEGKIIALLHSGRKVKVTLGCDLNRLLN